MESVQSQLVSRFVVGALAVTPSDGDGLCMAALLPPTVHGGRGVWVVLLPSVDLGLMPGQESTPRRREPWVLESWCHQITVAASWNVRTPEAVGVSHTLSSQESALPVCLAFSHSSLAAQP